jgi:hypothetical protein
MREASWSAPAPWRLEYSAARLIIKSQLGIKPPSGNHTKEQFVTAALDGVARVMSFLISSSRNQPVAE